MKRPECCFLEITQYVVGTMSDTRNKRDMNQPIATSTVCFMKPMSGTTKYVVEGYLDLETETNACLHFFFSNARSYISIDSTSDDLSTHHYALFIITEKLFTTYSIDWFIHGLFSGDSKYIDI